MEHLLLMPEGMRSVRRISCALAVGVWLWAAAPARAGEPGSELFCAGGQATARAEANATPAAAPRWPDVMAAAVLVAVLAVGIAYVVRNERRRRRAGAAPRPVGWSSYVAGGALGLVFAISLVAFGRPVGASAGVEQAARLLAGGLGAAWASSATESWPLWVVIGVVTGGLVSALARRERTPALPAPDPVPRARAWVMAFGAGVLLQMAATIAGGCTSGLALSGGIVLAPAAFVFMAAMFLGGIPTAWVAARGARRGRS